MSIHRVAWIFDDRIRPDTTGGHVRRALAQRVEVVPFPPDQAGSIPAAGFDLDLSIDDDTEHRLPDTLHPRADWAIDTHTDFPARLERSGSCDVAFAAQRDGVERLRAAGVASAAWLPLACDPARHRQHEVSQEVDVAFVGPVIPGPRAALLELIRRELPAHFIGRAYLQEMARVDSASRIVFDRSVGGDVNLRVFEAAACGSLLVTDDLAAHGQAELFTDGVHRVTDRDAGEMLETIGYDLEHAEEREAIAAAGRAEALARHTYRRRAERLLAEVASRLAPTVVAVAGIAGTVAGRAGPVPSDSA